MRIVYRPAAIQDIRQICAYIRVKLGNPQAAAHLKADILHGISSLKAFPDQGVPLGSRYDWLETEMRFLIIRKQLVFYEVQGETIEIVRVLDGRTDYLSRLFSESGEDR